MRRASVPKSRGFLASCAASSRPALAESPSLPASPALIWLPKARSSATAASPARRRDGVATPLILRPKARCTIAARSPSGVASAARRLPASRSSPSALATRRTSCTSSQERGRAPLSPRKMAARAMPASLGFQARADHARRPASASASISRSISDRHCAVGMRCAASGARSAASRVLLSPSAALAMRTSRSARRRSASSAPVATGFSRTADFMVLRPPLTERAASRAGRGAQRVTSQRPPDARITGGFMRILENSGLNAKVFADTRQGEAAGGQFRPSCRVKPVRPN